jgi:Carrier-protein-independent halogenase WelO5
MSSEQPSYPGASTVGKFFHLLEIEATDAVRHPGACEALRRGDLHGMLVHHVYGPDVLGKVVDRLERHDPPFLKTWFPQEFRSWFFGRNLNLAPADLREYFHESAQFHEHLRLLFPPALGITDYVAGILSQLDRGRAFVPAPGSEPGSQYMFTTLRAHLEGGYIPPHCDNEQAIRPSFRHLRTMIEFPMLSFVLALTLPEAGGALEIFDYRPEPMTEPPKAGAAARPRPKREEMNAASFRIPPGSLLIVDSGRYLHQVSPVAGPRKRWTACSFMALNREHDATYCWG